MRFCSTNVEKGKGFIFPHLLIKMKHDDFSDDEFHRYVSLTVIFGVVSKMRLKMSTRRTNREVYSCASAAFPMLKFN